MKYLLLAIIIVLVESCINETGRPYRSDYDDAMESTIDAWEEIISPVSDKCELLAQQTFLTEVTDFPDICQPENDESVVVGCYISMYSDETILISYIFILHDRGEDDKAATAVHEYTHLISECELGDSQIDHDDERMWSRYGEETVESKGVMGISFESE